MDGPTLSAAGERCCRSLNQTPDTFASLERPKVTLPGYILSVSVWIPRGYLVCAWVYPHIGGNVRIDFFFSF